MSPSAMNGFGTQPCRRVDYSAFWSDEANRRCSNVLGSLMEKFAGLEGVVQLGGGLPPPESFPLSAIHLTCRYGFETTTQSHICLVIYSAGDVPVLNFMRARIACADVFVVPAPCQPASAWPAFGVFFPLLVLFLHIIFIFLSTCLRLQWLNALFGLAMQQRTYACPDAFQQRPMEA